MHHVAKKKLKQNQELSFKKKNGGPGPSAAGLESSPYEYYNNNEMNSASSEENPKFQIRPKPQPKLWLQPQETMKTGPS